MNGKYFLSGILILLGLSILTFTLGTAEETFVSVYACQQTNCADLLVDLAKNSNDFVCAFYDLGEEKVLGALEKGSVLVFKDNYETYYSKNIKPVTSEGLMHHKFCVFDKRIVLTGSWNPTYRGTYGNDNVVLILESKKIAKYYLKEYERLLGNKYTRGSRDFTVANSSVEVVFCKVGNCEETLIEEINSARKSVNVLAFSFTSIPVADSLVEAKKRGVNVSVLMEASRRGKYSVDDYLAEKGIDIYFDKNPATMHEKVFIIDDKKFIMGSYNPTKNANERNDENMVIVRNKHLTEKMMIEFERINS